MKTKLIAIAAILVVLFALGFRVVHPNNGLQSAMGSAKSSIVIYKGSSNYAVGHKVVVEVAGQGKQTGIVKSASDGSVDVDTLVAFVRVKNEDVLGKLIVVVPFFGTLLGIVGL
ncbi:MAG: hypothetical protein KA423_04875 [Candidatus Planktophila sp.]|jgi:hypothetical protein|nr:hypothetical protein [Candidatus Planktophila sp.]MBP7903086.1 hypothetical protein [Candidatus Planktophila sp.]